MIALCHPMPPIPKRRNHASNRSRKPNIKMSKGLVRIIAGKHRARRIPVLIHEGLRPTGDRVKETLFNWLMLDINQSNCLDMFAGSGGLGIEALSRGASHVVFIEQDKKIAEQITTNLSTLNEAEQAQVLCTSALTSDLSVYKNQFGLVFIDPPFGKDIVQKSIDKLLTEGLLATNAKVYVEIGRYDNYQMPTQFTLLKEMKTSQVYACLYEYGGNL